MTPTPFRTTPEDMNDAKVGQAISPLLDSLNLTLNDVINILTGNVGADNLGDELKTINLAVDTLETAFPLVFSTKVKKPQVVVLGNCVPSDPSHSLATPFQVQGFSLTDKGQVSIPAISGILASNTYKLVFWVRA